MKYEVCCGCTEDAVMAWKGGADRIELNSALFLGGLTPSLGTLREVKRLITIPVMAMVRPREGGFCYSETEYRTMKEDARLLLENGADGLVFGFLQPDGTIDAERTAEFISLCGQKEAVFSRAIDVVPDMIAATRLLDCLGVTRVLTSGGKPTALEGTATIARMRRAVGTMQILPGGGIRPGNVAKLIADTGADQVHSSSRRVYFDTSTRGNPAIFFGGQIDGKYLPEDQCKVTDPGAVAEMKAVLNSL